MNIFQNEDSFIGCLDSSITEDSLVSIFRLAKQIQLRLGKQGYLLDCYLSLFLEGMAAGLTSEIADDGFMAEGRLHGILLHVLNGTEPMKTHIIYEWGREYYEQHVENYQFQECYTNQCLLMFPLADKIMINLTNKFVEEQGHNLNRDIDIVRVRELYNQISHLAGEAIMEELNERLRRRFLIAPLAMAFAQGMTDELLYRLTGRDLETSKQMFQLFMDRLPVDDML